MSGKKKRLNKQTMKKTEQRNLVVVPGQCYVNEREKKSILYSDSWYRRFFFFNFFHSSTDAIIIRFLVS